MMDFLFKAFLENSPCPVWMMGIDFRMIYINKAYRDLYNLENIDVDGKLLDELFPGDVGHTYKRQCSEVIENRQPTVFEGTANHTYLQCYTFPLMDNEGGLVALAGLIMDINDRKERELEVKNQNTILQTVIDTIPNVIFYKDKDSRYIRTNKECKEFYNRMGTGNIIGKTDLEINPDRLLAEKMMKDDKRIIESKQVHFTEPTLRLPNGKVERREVVKAPVINDQDEVIGIVGLSRDITQKKELEDKLKYLSYTDILTGVYNRTCFEEKIKEFQQESCLPIGVIMGDVNGLKLVNDTLGHLEGDRLLISISIVLMRVFGNKGDIFRWGGDEFVILVPNTDNQKCEEFVEEIKRQCKLESGSDLIELSISLGVAIYTDVEMDIFDVLKEAEEKVYRHKLLEQNSVVSSTLLSLQKSLEAKSMETELHTKRMLTNSMKIGRKMGLSMAQLDELALATKLHDIGKIGISEDILMKPGKLTDEEYEIIKSHSEKGFRIVKASHGLATVAKGVLAHHERYDGKGYPLGLKGEEIPIISRIISVVDTYDAMTNDRSYRKALTHEEAISELKKYSGMQFDPEVVDYFITIKRNQEEVVNS